MKRNFKRAISKILAGAMLITSSFTGVVSVNAAVTAFSRNFDDLSAGAYTDSGQEMKPGENNGNSFKVVTLPISGISGNDSGNCVQLVDGDASDAPQVSYDNGASDAKYTVTVDFATNDLDSENDRVYISLKGKKIESTSGKRFITVGINKNGKFSVSSDLMSDSIDTGITANTDRWYSAMFAVDDTDGSKTARVFLKEKAAANTAYKEIKTSDGKTIGEWLNTTTDTSNQKDERQLRNLQIRAGTSSTVDAAGKGTYFDNVSVVDGIDESLISSFTGSFGEGGGTTPGGDEVTTTGAFTFTNEKINITGADGAVTAVTGGQVDSFDKATNTVYIKKGEYGSDGSKINATVVSGLINKNGIQAAKSDGSSVNVKDCASVDGETLKIQFDEYTGNKAITLKFAEKADGTTDPVNPGPGGDDPGTSTEGGIMATKTTDTTGNEIDATDLQGGEEFVVTYELTKEADINNYTFFVNFDPKVLELVGAFDDGSSDKAYGEALANVVHWSNAAADITNEPFVSPEVINKQMRVVPDESNDDYLDCGGGNADGTKTAAQLGRIKLAGVAGLLGYQEASNEHATSTVIENKGVLFKLRFKMLETGGSADVSISAPKTKDGEAGQNIFYATPVSGETSKPIELGGNGLDDTKVPVAAPEVVAGAPVFSYTGTTSDTAITINISENGEVAVKNISNDNPVLKGYLNKTITFDGNFTSADVLENFYNDLKAELAKSNPELNVESTTPFESIVITNKDDSAKTITFTVARSEDTRKYPDFTYTGDKVGITVKNDNVTVTGGTWDGDAKTITLAQGVEITAEALAKDISGKDGCIAKASGDVITVSKGGKNFVFTLKPYSGGSQGDDVTKVELAVGGDDAAKVTFEKADGKLSTITVTKGKATIATDGKSAYVPYLGSAKLITALEESDFVPDKGTVTYDKTKKELTVTMGSDTFKATLFVYGDVNDDGNANAVDVGLIYNKLRNALTFDELKNTAGDVNGDSNANAVDVGLIYNKLRNAVTLPTF